MSYVNRTRPQWQARWAEPVQFETPAHLTGTYLDDGRGILVWINSGAVRVGFTDNTFAFTQNNTCTSATTIPITTRTPFATSVFRVGGRLFICLDEGGSTGIQNNNLWIADSATNPTSWSLYSTIKSVSIGKADFHSPEENYCGMPYVNGTTWVLPITDHKQGFSQSHVRANSVWYSTDDGITWSMRTEYRVGGLGQNAGGRCPHIGVDPATGYLFHAGRSGSSSGTWHWRRSTDGGASWTDLQTGGVLSSAPGVPFLNDGVSMYGTESADVGAGIARYNSPNSDVLDRTALFRGPDLDSLPQGHFLVCDGGTDTGLLFFNYDRVLGTGGGWNVGVHHVRIN